MERDVLFLLAAPFEDEGALWFCQHCAMLEGALLANPHWAARVDVRRIPFPRPRQQVVDLIGEENQWLPVLILKEGGWLVEPEAIAQSLARRFGGAAPRPWGGAAA